eukprot:3189508-Pyramimonas_sp.AAC.1
MVFWNTKNTNWPAVGSGHSKCGSGMTKNTKWPTVGSGPGHSKCGLGMVFWEREEHEVSWLRAFQMWPGNG